MDFEKTVDYIYSLNPESKQPTLKRIKDVLSALGNPQKSFSAIHIAGTNGKGSVTSMISEAVMCAGYKTGKYISPHITDFTERISVNGKPIPKEDFCRISKTVAEKKLPLNFFEFTTAVAFLYFKEQGVEVAVLEAGLGGRLDATNACENKLISVITKIGLDHTEKLGGTKELITAEKCAIANGGRAVISPNQCPEVTAAVKKLLPDAVFTDLSDVKIFKSDIAGNVFSYKGTFYETSLAGEYQVENAVTAIEALKHCGLDIGERNIIKGIKEAFLPARMQILEIAPLTVLDGAHNPDGAASLAPFMKKAAPVTAVIGVMRDKDYDAVLETTLPYAQNVICVKADNYYRALPPEELAETARKYCKNVSVCDNLHDALKTAQSENLPVFIYGSLYLASNILKLEDFNKFDF